ncbi:putative ribosomal protein S6 modification protein RimK homolog [Streptomyces sp. NBRC 110611]|uniref:ATP-grasp domain-containing protein n=1 Tax=Streptomyces sp. NBRC 110611 TaxID=1621259 RepID=UPI00082F6E9B|nr:ATP-grasp domain-containing protein [Streptomyces sp. NBRC 110611]GAU67900.1 putative ribosomal protein S6 modification protein RimK homolog [Streptomyces sp. NBRC 110611]
MRLCFLVEEQYRYDGMPLDVIGRLSAWGHQVDVLWPGRSLIPISEAIRAGSHDAWVLKTVSGGPGLTLLEAAAAVGLPTVNDVRAIRGVRDKALAAVLARAHGLPVPVTYAAARAEEFAAIPEAEYPLVVKPADGSSGRAVRFVESPNRLVEPGDGPVVPGERPGVSAGAAGGLLIAQPYVPNSGTDLKVYCVAGELYATERCSPLHPGHAVTERQVPLTPEVAGIAQEVGTVFGLDLYGVDILLGPDGPVVVDINDFPSFRQVPDAVARVSAAVLRLARRGNGPRLVPDPAASVAAATVPLTSIGGER